jgi:hypothetical protein
MRNVGRAIGSYLTEEQARRDAALRKASAG